MNSIARFTVEGDSHPQGTDNVLGSTQAVLAFSNFCSHSLSSSSRICDADSSVTIVCEVFPLNMNTGNEKAVTQQALKKNACLNDSCPHILTLLMFLTDGEILVLLLYN